MSDVWSDVESLDAATQERLADVLEIRGSNPQQQAMRRAFLDSADFPAGADVLDVGCGTGVLTRLVASRGTVGSIVGVDPAPFLVERAMYLAAGVPNVSFRVADGRDLPFEAGTFDVVLFDSVLCHTPDPGAALAEAGRVLRAGGRLAVFDGDYASTTVALAEHDPLQACVNAMMAASVHDRALVRRLPALVRAAGFEVDAIHSHGFVDPEGGYMLTIVDRGADILAAAGHLGADAAMALKAEGRRRVEARSFFGHIAYGSLIAHKP